MDRVKRADASTITGVEKTPQGFLKIPANLTRTGVLHYRRADGSVFRELRLPEEVFSPSSLASLEGAPVTDLHPAEFVGPGNVRNLQRGFVGPNVRQDGKHVSAHVIVQDAELISAIESGKRKELSPGYTCRIDATPGVYEGEEYDGIQRDIVYNHLAVGPRGWGRSGASVALRVDEKDLPGDPSVSIHFDSWPGEGPITHTEEKPQMALKTIRIDGNDVGVDEAHADKVVAAIDKLTAERDAQKARADKAEARADAASNPAHIQALVAARASLVSTAAKILGPEVKLDGMSDRDVKLAVVQKIDGVDLKDKSDDYVGVFYDAALTHAAKRADGLDSFRADPEKTETKTDGADEIEKARKAMREKTASAWKEPLLVSRK